MSDITAAERIGVVPSLSCPPLATASRGCLVVVDDDDLVRKTLEADLMDAEYEVRGFATGATALAHLLEAKDVDIVLLDWKMPGMAGIDVLHRMREAGLSVPVVFLTGLTDQSFEELALRDGAVDFVEKGRSFSILLHRINLILEGIKGPAAANDSAVILAGDLQLKRDIFQAFWRGREVPLTLTEFRIIDLLAAQPGEHVSYRAIYDLVHGKDFMAGQGPEGYRANVRTFIKRIRKKFRDIDDNWDLIENYASFGYRWRGGHAGAAAP